MMKKIILFTISSILLTHLLLVTTFAATAQAQAGPFDDDDAFTCENISTARAGFYVILEEPLATKAQAEKMDDTILCFRVCYKKVEDGKRICDLMATCPNDPERTCEPVQIIKATSGAGLLYTYVGMIYIWAAGTVGIISVFVMVYSGIGIMMAGGDSGAIENHKKRITQSLFGLVILFLSGLILYTINPTFFV